MFWSCIQRPCWLTLAELSPSQMAWVMVLPTFVMVVIASLVGDATGAAWGHLTRFGRQ